CDRRRRWRGQERSGWPCGDRCSCIDARSSADASPQPLPLPRNRPPHLTVVYCGEEGRGEGAVAVRDRCHSPRRHRSTHGSPTCATEDRRSRLEDRRTVAASSRRTSILNPRSSSTPPDPASPVAPLPTASPGGAVMPLLAAQPGLLEQWLPIVL